MDIMDIIVGIMTDYGLVMSFAVADEGSHSRLGHRHRAGVGARFHRRYRHGRQQGLERCGPVQRVGRHGRIDAA